MDSLLEFLNGHCANRNRLFIEIAIGMRKKNSQSSTDQFDWCEKNLTIA